jgi:hypothetical protein
MPKNIAILGTAPSSRLLAPFDEPEWEIWACGPANYDLPRIDVFFELHSLPWLLRDPSMANYRPWLAQQSKVFMQAQSEHFPGSVRYPVEAMFAKYWQSFFSSSVAFMLALAIEQKPEVLGFWGIDMSAGEEYGHQRMGCHYFIERARQAGIKVVSPPESDILHPIPPYAYREADPMWWKMNTRWKELHARAASNLAQQAELRKEELHLRGAMDDAQYVINTYSKGDYYGTS